MNFLKWNLCLLALGLALAAGCRSARDSDFTLRPDRAAIAALGVPRWPHSSQLTRHLHAFRSQHVHALRRALEHLVATHSTARRRLRSTHGSRRRSRARRTRLRLSVRHATAGAGFRRGRLPAVPRPYSPGSSAARCSTGRSAPISSRKPSQTMRGRRSAIGWSMSPRQTGTP